MIAAESMQEGYLIRGHHFTTLLKAYSPFFGTDGIARDLVLTMDEYRRGAKRSEVDFDLLDLPQLPHGDQLVEWEKAYAIDMIGDSPAQAAHVQQLIEESISRFQQLDDTAGVTVAVGVMDDQCRSCVFQRHCQNTSEASLKPDYDALTTIQSVIVHLGLATKSVVSGKEESLQSWKLATDAATMHSVVDFFKELNPENPQLPFIRAAYDPTFTLLNT